MSRKLKVGESVRVNETGEYGVIKGREIVPTDSKRIEIQYIVKTGEGINKWKAYSKKELSPIVKTNTEVYPKVYTNMFIDDKTDRELMLVAIVGKNYVDHKVLRMGYALRHPHDESNTKMALKIAKHRAIERPICILESHYKGEFNEDTVNSLMSAKARYIFTHLENFVKK